MGLNFVGLTFVANDSTNMLWEFLFLLPIFLLHSLLIYILQKYLKNTLLVHASPTNCFVGQSKVVKHLQVLHHPKIPKKKYHHH